MAIQKKSKSTTFLVVGFVIGLIGGAFLPDNLSPIALLKKLKSKKKKED